MTNAAEVSNSSYKGWDTLALTSGPISVEMAPALGGRIIQFRLNDFEYLWASDHLAGRVPPPSGLGPDGEWLNYGGDKLWPAPQGWDGPEQWPGPPDAILDGSPHEARILQRTGDSVAVKLTSRPDPRTGIQFSRVVRITDGVAGLHVRARMTNTDSRSRRWGIWTVTQLNATSHTGTGWNRSLRSYCPLNPDSQYAAGYRVMFGEADNPQFQADEGMLKVHYQYEVGKLGLDNNAGWIATVDGESGYLFIQRFEHASGREYPDGASIEYWTSGLGTIRAWGRTEVMPDDPVQTPYLVESELLSPFAELQPGEHADFEYEWRAANIGGDFPILGCAPGGCIAEPFRVVAADGVLQLTGRFGIFQTGEVRFEALDSDGKSISQLGDPLPVSPTRPVFLTEQLDASSLPAGATAISVSCHDAHGTSLGELTRATIAR